MVVERGEVLSERELEEMGQTGVESSLGVGEEVVFDKRQVGWVVKEKGGQTMGQSEGRAVGRARLEEERRRKEELREAEKGVGFMQASQVKVTAEQRTEDAMKRREEERRQRGEAEAGREATDETSRPPEDSFDYTL